MTRRFLLEAVLLLGALTASCARSGVPRFDPDKMLEPSQVRPGMEAVGRSVFSGTKIEEFHMKILGVLPRADLGNDMIIARILDGPIVERKTGIIAGMSGSPVYCEGKLIGAIAYSWTFQREPIAGITAITSMLDTFAGEKGSHSPRTARATYTPLELHGRRVASVRVVRPPLADVPPFDADGALTMTPCGTLLTCSGFSRRGMRMLRQIFEPYGIVPVVGPGAKRDPVPTELVPGAACGIQFVTGSFEAAGIGTVCYRDGDNIIAFGHPLMHLGAVQFPLTTAWIYDFLPSYARSFKYASAMNPVGALRQDRGWAVGGVLGETAPTIPAVIHVRDSSRGVKHVYQVRIAHHKELTSGFLRVALSDSLVAGFKPGGEGTVQVRFIVDGENGARIARENVYFSKAGVTRAAISEVLASIDLLRLNRFAPQIPKNVHVEVDFTTENRSAEIRRVYTRETVAKAGEDLHIHVQIKPHEKPLAERVLTLHIPEDVARGSMRVAIANGFRAYRMRSSLGVTRPRLQRLDTVIDEFVRMERDDQLVARAALPNQTLGLESQVLPRLPSPMVTVMSSARDSDVVRGKEELVAVLDTPWVLEGSFTLTIPTEDKQGKKGKVSSTTVTVKPSVTKPTSPSTKSTGVVPEVLAWAAEAFLPPEAAFPWEQFGPEDQEKIRRTIEKSKAAAAEKKRTLAEREQSKKGELGKDQEAEQKPEAKTEPPVARQLSVWSQTTSKDFEKGKPKGCTYTNTGDLILAPPVTQVATSDEERLWCAAADAKGRVYFGSGPHGRILRLSKEGKLETIASLEAVAVHALLAQPDGSLLAGTVPGGRIYRVTPQGKASLVYDTGERYVWALAAAPDGTVYAATGSRGRIFKLPPQGKPGLFATLPQAHVLCLAVTDKYVYAGTAEDGLVFRLTKMGAAETIFDSADRAITALALGAKGALYAGGGQGGKVELIRPDGSTRTVIASTEKNISALCYLDGVLYAATGAEGRLLALWDEDTWSVIHDDDLVSHWLCLVSPRPGRLYVGSASPAAVARLDTAGKAAGDFESSIFDAKRLASWDLISWRADLPSGCTVEVRTRSGNSTDSDDGWSPWSRPYSGPGEEKVHGPPSRYVQYKVTLRRTEGKALPRVHSLSIRYLPENARPKVEVTEPKEGALLSGKQELKWKGSDDDKDTLLYSLQLAARGSDEWKPIESEIFGDTSKTEDGHYTLKLVGSDSPSNPADPREKEALVEALVIDNTPPTLKLDQEDPQPAEDQTVTISGSASDLLTKVSSVEWRIGEKGKWRAAVPADGLYDGHTEQFKLRTGPLKPGKQTLVVRARDGAKNKTERKFEFELPGGKEQEKEGDKKQEGKPQGEAAKPETKLAAPVAPVAPVPEPK